VDLEELHLTRLAQEGQGLGVTDVEGLVPAAGEDGKQKKYLTFKNFFFEFCLRIISVNH